MQFLCLPLLVRFTLVSCANSQAADVKTLVPKREQLYALRKTIHKHIKALKKKRAAAEEDDVSSDTGGAAEPMETDPAEPMANGVVDRIEAANLSETPTMTAKGSSKKERKRKRKEALLESKVAGSDVSALPSPPSAFPCALLSASYG
jgi:hypothetical protein